MDGILYAFLALLLFVCVVWLGFWILGMMGLPDNKDGKFPPVLTIARIIWGIFCLIILIGYFTGGIGFHEHPLVVR